MTSARLLPLLLAPNAIEHITGRHFDHFPGTSGRGFHAIRLSVPAGPFPIPLPILQRML
jgi:hypothetical protein